MQLVKGNLDPFLCQTILSTSGRAGMRVRMSLYFNMDKRMKMYKEKVEKGKR